MSALDVFNTLVVLWIVGSVTSSFVVNVECNGLTVRFAKLGEIGVDE